MTRRHRGFTHVHPSGLPQPVAPGWNGSPWAFPGLRTPQLPAAHARAGTVLAHWTGNYAIDISRSSFDECHSLTCDLVSHPPLVIQADQVGCRVGRWWS